MLDRVWLVCRDDRFKDDIRCERGTFAGLCICDDVMLVDENRDVLPASHSRNGDVALAVGERAMAIVLAEESRRSVN